MTRLLKIATIIFIYTLNQKCIAQELIEKVDESDGFSTRTLFLYSDSTFAYLRGGCTQLTFTTGKFKTESEQLVLIPDSAFVPEFQIEKNLLDSCSKVFDVVFISKDHIEFGSDWTLVPIGTIQSWNSENEESLIFFTNSNSAMKMDTLNFELRELRKQDCLDYDLALTDLYKVLGKMYTFPVSANVERVEIKFNLPFEIARYNVMGILHFETLDSRSLKIGNKNYLIEKYH